VSETTETTPVEPQWADDGHQVRVTLGRYGLEYAVACPFDGADMADVPSELLPVCRRSTDDDGNPLRDRPPIPECGLELAAQEWTADEFFDTDAMPPAFEVAALPVVYRFEGDDGCGVHVRPKTESVGVAAELRAVAAATNGQTLRRQNDALRATLEAVVSSRDEFEARTYAAESALASVSDPRDIGPSAWVYLDADGRLSAHAFATEAVCRDAAIGDYLTLQPVELPGWERPEFFWRPEDGNDDTFDLMADGYPTCYTVQRLPVLGAPQASAARTETESPLETAQRWRTVGPHPAPGEDTPTHPGPGETCTAAACVKSRAQHEAAGEIEDLTRELFGDGSGADGCCCAASENPPTTEGGEPA